MSITKHWAYFTTFLCRLEIHGSESELQSPLSFSILQLFCRFSLSLPSSMNMSMSLLHFPLCSWNRSLSQVWGLFSVFCFCFSLLSLSLSPLSKMLFFFFFFIILDFFLFFFPWFLVVLGHWGSVKTFKILALWLFDC